MKWMNILYEGLQIWSELNWRKKELFFIKSPSDTGISVEEWSLSYFIIHVDLLHT